MNTWLAFAALIVGRQRHEVTAAIACRLPSLPRLRCKVGIKLPTRFEVSLAGGLSHAELFEQHVGVGIFEIVPQLFLLGLQEHVAIGHLLGALAAVEIELEDVTCDALGGAGTEGCHQP